MPCWFSLVLSEPLITLILLMGSDFWCWLLGNCCLNPDLKGFKDGRTGWEERGQRSSWPGIPAHLLREGRGLAWVRRA